MCLDSAKFHSHARRFCLPQSWKTRTCLLVVASALMAPTLALAGGLRPVVENGRVVYVNDETADQTQAKATESAKPVPAARRFIYWSVTERKWKPVPVPSVGALRAARTAAAEVTTYVASQPESKTESKSPKAAPVTEYAGLTAGRMVTSVEVDKAINDSAQRHGVDANLVRAIIQIESGFNPRAVSRKGALGLMQLMPTTARSLKVDNPFDPAQNVDAGVRHLKGLLQSYKGDVPLSLAAYNAGEGAVARSGNNIPPFAETREYVRRITKIYGGALQRPWTSLGTAVRMERDARGILTITNTD